MAKRHLTEQQRRRIRAHQQHKQVAAFTESSATHSLTGRIMAHFGTSAEIITPENKRFSCAIRQNLPPLVTGDNVVFEPMGNTHGVIVALVPRISLLSRTLPSGDSRIMAANVTRVFVVIAPEPEINWLTLDRYLIGLEQCGLPAFIIMNKCDLPVEASSRETFQVYGKIGYPTLAVSAQDVASLQGLLEALNHQTSIFIGQSGVGKSSLIQALLPHEQLKTGALSARSKLGAHTTTTARMYEIPTGGYVIDSPGIRDFGLNSLEFSGLAHGFPEFRPFLGQCKFKNCTHINEPTCALREAATKALIPECRLHNYQTLFHELENMTKDYGKNSLN